jgi:hypothetical protein
MVEIVFILTILYLELLRSLLTSFIAQPKSLALIQYRLQILLMSCNLPCRNNRLIPAA